MIFFLEEYSLCFQLRNPIITLPQFQGTYFGDSITKADEYARRKARWVGVFVPRSQRKSTLLSLSVALLPLKKQREQVAELFQKVFVFYYFFYVLFVFFSSFLSQVENGEFKGCRAAALCRVLWELRRLPNGSFHKAGIGWPAFLYGQGALHFLSQFPHHSDT